MQEVLLVVLRMRHRTGLGQPVVVAHQVRERGLEFRALRQRGRRRQARRDGNETAQPLQAVV
ncbi:hypothetical protein D9M68_467530 [compost metagenome]